MSWIRVIFFFLIFFLAGHVFANSSEKNVSVEKDYSGKQTQEWQEIQTKVQAAKGKLEQQEIIVKGLLESKHVTGAHGSQAANQTESEQEKVKTLKTEHQKLLKLTKEYNELRDQLETRFPEKSAKEGRIYNRINPASLDVIENDMSIEGRLRRIDRKLSEKFPKSAIPKEGHADSRAKASNRVKKKIKPAPEVTDSIILQK